MIGIFNKQIERMGFKMEEATVDMRQGIVATINDEYGNEMKIAYTNDQNYFRTARIDKINGTHKWYYEKTDAQLMVIIKRCMEGHNFVIEDNNTEESTIKEENKMKSEFTLNGVTYTMNNSGYCYKTTGTFDKKGNEMTMRIGKHVFEQAFDEFIINGHDQGSAWEQEADDEYTTRKEEQERKQVESDKEAENAVNSKDSAPKAKKIRKSKDIGYTHSSGLTLTAKQVDFIRHIPDTSFYENGLNSTPWCDVLADEIGGQFAGKPMTVGAMLSTLKEKGVIVVGVERVNGHRSKYFCFTDLGKEIASELGLE